MSWCEKNEVCDLILVGRFSPEASPQHRQAADVRFIDLCQNAINVGDVLVSICLDPSIPSTIRLTCALAVEPIVTVWGWSEGNRFSDKDCLSSSLVAYFNSGLPSTEPGHLVRAILRFLSKIIVLESNAEKWTGLLQGIATNALISGGFGMELLILLSSEAKTSPELWLFLARNVVEPWLEPLRFPAPFRSSGLEVVLNLLSKRCKPSEESKFKLSDQCFLLQKGMFSYIAEVLERQVQDAQNRTSDPTERLQYFKESGRMLEIAHRLVRSQDAALLVFQMGSFFVANVQPLYLSELGQLSPEILKMTESGLECLQDILISYPDGEYPKIVETISAIIPFMIRLQDEGSTVEEAFLADLLMEDETVPLGCGGDDVPSLSGSIVELFLEAHPEFAQQMLASLLPLSEQVEQQSNKDVSVNFAANALIHVSRVYVASNRSLADDLGPQNELLQHLFSVLLSKLDDEYLSSLLIFGISQCFLFSTNEGLLAEFLGFLDTVRVKAMTQCLCGVVMYSIGSVLEHAEQSLARRILRESWWNAAVDGAAASTSQFSLFLHGFLIITIMKLQPDAKILFRNNCQMVCSIVENYCGFSLTRALPQQLQDFLNLLLVHPPQTLCSSFGGAIERVTCRCSNFQSPSSSIVLRQMSLFMLDIVIQVVQGKGTLCPQCCLGFVHSVVPLLAAFGSEMGPFDEGTSRSLASCLGAAVVVGGASLDPYAEAILCCTRAVLAGCTSERHTSQTISGVCGSLTLQGIMRPVILDADPTPLVRQVFEGDLITGRRGVNYLGAVLFVSVFSIRSPFTLHRAFGSMPSADKRNDAAWQAAWGWCSSLAPFADDITWSYILCSWLRMILYISALPPDQHAIFFAPRPHITLFPFPSIFAQKVPGAPFSNLSFFSAVVAGLLWVKNSFSKCAQVSGIRKELQPLVALDKVLPSLITDGDSLKSMNMELLLTARREEAVEALLEKLCDMGFKSIIVEQHRTHPMPHRSPIPSDGKRCKKILLKPLQRNFVVLLLNVLPLPFLSLFLKLVQGPLLLTRDHSMLRSVRRVVVSPALELVAALSQRAISLPSQPPGKADMEKMRQEAEKKGFARRDTVQGIDFLLKNTPSVERLPDSEIPVVNMPPKNEVTPFDSYKRSTTEFTSIVAPHGTNSVGLGAGFGVKEDKRLSFLRPRKTLQPRGVGDMAPKFDENGFLIDLSLPDAELKKRRREYLQSFQGTTMSAREHFLLVDLDFEKDSILFGSTREEFERNVRLMKKVVVGYQKWERSDNFYYYATIVLKIFTFWILMECAHQYVELQLLSGNYEVFAEAIEDEIHDLSTKMARDFQEARETLAHNPPNFTPVLNAIRNERERVRASEENVSAIPVQDSTVPTETDLDRLKATALELSKSPSTSSGSDSTPERRRQEIPVAEVYAKARAQHPMDTLNEKAILTHERETSRANEMQRLQKRLQSQENGLFERLKSKIWRLFSRPAYLMYHPLTNEDLSRFSYAASPTAVEAVRLLRRILLPKSEDFTQIVREEMLEYKNEKLKKATESIEVGVVPPQLNGCCFHQLRIKKHTTTETFFFYEQSKALGGFSPMHLRRMCSFSFFLIRFFFRCSFCRNSLREEYRVLWLLQWYQFSRVVHIQKENQLNFLPVAMSEDHKEEEQEEQEEQQYVPLPSSLFSFAPLEEYLQHLTFQLACDINDIKRQMSRSSDNAKHARMSVRQIKQFLSEKMPQLEKSHKAALAAVSSVTGTPKIAASNSLPSGGGSMHSQGSTGEKEPILTDRTMTPLRPPSGSKGSEFSVIPPKEDEREGSRHTPAEQGEQATTEEKAEPAAVSGMQLTDIAPSASDEDEDEKGSIHLSLSEIREDIGRKTDSRNSAPYSSSRPGSQNDRLSDRSWNQNSTTSHKRVMALIKGLQEQIDEVKKEMSSGEEKSQKLMESARHSRHQIKDALVEVRRCEQDCHHLFQLLGGSHAEAGESDAVGTQSGEATSVQSTPSEQQMENMIANSPLLLALRRVLLKDLADRVANSAEVQSKDITTTVSALREDMDKFVTEEKVMAMVEAHGKDEVREVITEYERRLMEIELTSVRRQEFATAMKTKADAYLINQQTKVGASEVLSMEKRLYERIEELEERVAYYEAERSELREIILSLLKVENPGMETTALLARKAFPPFRPRTVVYSSADTKDYNPSVKEFDHNPNSSKMSEPSFQPHEVTGKTIYRLMSGDGEQNTFATLSGRRGQRPDSKDQVNSSSQIDSSASSPPVRENSTLNPKLEKRSSRSSPKNSEKSELAKREMIGMTRNQEAYARFVTQDYNRNVVENLPPLPYKAAMKQRDVMCVTLRVKTTMKHVCSSVDGPLQASFIEQFNLNSLFFILMFDIPILLLDICRECQSFLNVLHRMNIYVWVLHFIYAFCIDQVRMARIFRWCVLVCCLMLITALTCRADVKCESSDEYVKITISNPGGPTEGFFQEYLCGKVGPCEGVTADTGSSGLNSEMNITLTGHALALEAVLEYADVVREHYRISTGQSSATGATRTDLSASAVYLTTNLAVPTPLFRSTTPNPYSVVTKMLPTCPASTGFWSFALIGILPVGLMIFRYFFVRGQDDEKDLMLRGPMMVAQADQPAPETTAVTGTSVAAASISGVEKPAPPAPDLEGAHSPHNLEHTAVVSPQLPENDQQEKQLGQQQELQQLAAQQQQEYEFPADEEAAELEEGRYTVEAYMDPDTGEVYNVYVDTVTGEKYRYEEDPEGLDAGVGPEELIGKHTCLSDRSVTLSLSGPIWLQNKTKKESLPTNEEIHSPVF
eukprot:gene10653-7400_t